MTTRSILRGVTAFENSLPGLGGPNPNVGSYICFPSSEDTQLTGTVVSIPLNEPIYALDWHTNWVSIMKRPVFPATPIATDGHTYTWPELNPSILRRMRDL